MPGSYLRQDLFGLISDFFAIQSTRRWLCMLTLYPMDVTLTS